MTLAEFNEKYCQMCGSQRCEGPGTEWFGGCIHRGELTSRGQRSKIYTVSYMDTNGCEHVVHSGRSYTPFSTEKPGTARAMATRLENRKRNIKEILIYECDFETMRINLIETRAAVQKQSDSPTVAWARRTFDD